jgi:pyruvate/2-oxoglutarate dehydrogenase complex dihydrolipoamide acyltransferase (E2) component
MGKKFGDRHDGKRVKVRGILGLINHLKPKRSESEVYIIKKFDVTETLKYYEKKKKEANKLGLNMTMFHILSTAVAKTVYLRPKLNRFIINKQVYDRNEVSFGFVGKTSFEDKAEELLQCLKIEKTDNLLAVSAKLTEKVKIVKANKQNDADKLVDMISKAPAFVKSIIIVIFRFLDNHDLIPRSLTDNLIYHVSVLITNLGSIKCGAIYHNLTNFGTNSVLVAIGEIKKEVMVNENGKMEVKDCVEIGFTLDERIADGFYFAKSVRYFDYILQHPQFLDEAMEEGIDVEY